MIQANETTLSVDAATKLLNENIQKLIEKESYKQMLQIMSRQKNYSLNNMLLIMAQRPDARVTLGFKEWKKIGRHVQKGEKAIKILAPMIGREESEKKDQITGKPVLENGKPVVESKKVIRGFKLVSVFDISQTEGPALVSPQEVISRSMSDDDYMAKLYKDFKSYLNENKIPVTEFPSMNGEYGYYSRNEHRINISSDAADLSDTTKFKTLVHEYAHSILHHKDSDMKDLDRGYKESQAESVAYVVNHYYGFDTGDVSNGYIATWGGDPDLIRQAIEDIKEVAGQIIEEINALQKEKLQELKSENNKDYEQTLSYLKEKVGLSELVFDPANSGKTSLQLIELEKGFVASGNLEYSDKSEKWYIRTNRNMIEPIEEIGESGKFAILNLEKEIDEVKSYSTYARIATDYSVQETENNLYVVQFTPGKDIHRSSLEVVSNKHSVDPKSHQIISRAYLTKEEALDFKIKASLGQALQEEMVHVKQLQNSNNKKELENTISDIRKNVVTQASSFVSHYSNRTITFTTEGSTKVGWTVLRNPSVRSIEDLEKFAKEKKGVLAGREITRALRESSYIEQENSKQKKSNTKEIDTGKEHSLAP